VNDVTLVRVASKNVGANLAEGPRKDATIELIHNCVDFGFRRGDASLGVAIR
jgi:hypothetical protein